MRYYMYQENLFAHSTTYSPWKIHTPFSLSEIIFDTTSSFINSGTRYQKLFPSKRNLRGISHFLFLIIANKFNTADLELYGIIVFTQFSTKINTIKTTRMFREIL